MDLNDVELTIVQKCQLPDGSLLRDTRSVYKPRTLEDFRKRYAALFRQQYDKEAVFTASFPGFDVSKREDTITVIDVCNESDWNAVPEPAEIEQRGARLKSVSADAFLLKVQGRCESLAAQKGVYTTTIY